MSKFCRFCGQEIHASYCFYAAIAGIIFGIVASFYTKTIFCQSWLWLIAAILLLLFALNFSNRLTLLIACLAGMIIANFRVAPELISQDYFVGLTGSTVTISGKIAGDPDISSGQVKFKLSNLRLQLPRDQPELQLAGTVYVQLTSSRVELERSDIVTLTGKVGSNFGTYSATFYRPELVDVERAAAGDVFARLKTWFAHLVHNLIPSPAADLGLGYLMGLKSGLPDSLADALRAVGMTHVVVASGAHLGILVSAARKIFGKISKFAGLLFSLLLIAGFVLLVGFTPSMTRAGLVASLSLLLGYVGRKFTPLRLLSFVACLTLLIVPSNFQNLGWQLSFASFFGIMLVAPRLQAFLYGGKHPPWLASMLITSLSTSLICAPILIYNFGSLSLLALIANLIILPTLPYAMLLVFLTGATSFWLWLAQIFATLAQALLEFHIFVVHFLSEKTMFIIELTANDPRIFLIYLPVLLLLIWLARHQSKKPLAESKNVIQ